MFQLTLILNCKKFIYSRNLQLAKNSLKSSIIGVRTRSFNAITDSVRNTPSGKRISYYANADKSTSTALNFNFNLARRFNKNQFQLTYNGQYNTDDLPNYVDGVYNISEAAGLFNQVTLQFSLRSLLVLNLNQSFQRNKTKQRAAGLQSFSNTNETTKFGLVLNATAGFTFSSTVDYLRNSNLDKPIVLWNAFASYRFLKQQGELKFSAMDIFKQYQNVFNSVNAYGTTTRITNGLQQFFLLTFSYYPRKFGKTELKRQSAQGGND